METFRVGSRIPPGRVRPPQRSDTTGKGHSEQNSEEQHIQSQSARVPPPARSAHDVENIARGLNESRLALMLIFPKGSPTHKLGFVQTTESLRTMRAVHDHLTLNMYINIPSVILGYVDNG